MRRTRWVMMFVVCFLATASAFAVAETQPISIVSGGGMTPIPATM